LRKLVDEATRMAMQSTVGSRHGAVLFSQSGRKICDIGKNEHGNSIYGFDVPSIHAEAKSLGYLRDKCHCVLRGLQKGTTM